MPLELITDEATAREDSLLPATVGFDLETEPRARAAAGMARDHKAGRLAAPGDPPGQTGARPVPPGRGWLRSTIRRPGWCTWSTSAPCRLMRSRACGRAAW